MAATPIPDWTLAKGIYDLGIGLCTHVQNGAPAPEPRTANMAVDPSQSGGTAPEKIAAAQESIQKALDCQTFIMSFLTKDVAQPRQRLRLLEGLLMEEVDAMITAANENGDVRAVRDFKAQIGNVTLAYEPLVKRMITAAEHKPTPFPRSALRDAAKAETNANWLYSWAKTYVPTSVSADVKKSKAKKLELIPYIVAMAYAIRVKLDVHYVKSRWVEEAERLEYLERSRDVVEQFANVLQVAVLATVKDSSLLEVALEYHLALMTYETLIAALQASVEMMLTPKEAPKPMILWDDGLSGIRAIFRIDGGNNNNDNTDTVISFENKRETIKWLEFAGYDMELLKNEDFTDSIQFYKLLCVLGVDLDDTSDKEIDSISLAPDYRQALFQLRPAHALRTDLLNKLNFSARGIDVERTLLQSIARIRNETQFAACHHAIAERNTPKHAYTITQHSDTVYGVAVSPNGECIISGSQDDTARVWSRATGQPLSTFKKHFASVVSVAPFFDGKRVVSGGGVNDKMVRIWSPEDDGSATELLVLSGHSDRVWGVAVSPDDDCTVASASADKTVKLWNADTGDCEATLTEHSDCVFCVAFSVNGEMIASGSADHTVRLWNIRSQSPGHTLTGHTDSVYGVAFAGASGDLLVSCSGDGTIRVWNWRTGKFEKELTGHTSWVLCVAVFPGGKRLASGSRDETIRIWNVHSGKELHRLSGHTDWVRCVTVSRDGHTLVSGSRDNSVMVWTVR